ncbi:hypothetical protein CPB83DRAFT_841188 [Crepidotus variabilis]|uniref:Uncharacterized protein n=1 Tax=Crepidotus variabilis TaxID=179855 RepID=A0A9P6E2Y0_9AGAR|nr:hypothetical protein CPB83DRAFT_841188 [Crepidotus variabilis]
MYEGCGNADMRDSDLYLQFTETIKNGDGCVNESDAFVEHYKGSKLTGVKESKLKQVRKSLMGVTEVHQKSGKRARPTKRNKDQQSEFRSLADRWRDERSLRGRSSRGPQVHQVKREIHESLAELKEIRPTECAGDYPSFTYLSGCENVPMVEMKSSAPSSPSQGKGDQSTGQQSRTQADDIEWQIKERPEKVHSSEGAASELNIEQ